MEEIVYSEGYCTNLYLASERINHGTDGFLEILCSTIECVHLICAQRGDDMPEHLVIQTDNTVSQSKNSFAHLFQALLVSRRLFKTVTMNYFMVGHTHEDIDQLFALVVKYILQKTSDQAPAEILEYIAVHLRPRIVARGEVLNAQLLTAVRDFCSWMLPVQLTLHNGFQNRGGIECAHSFTYKTGQQLTADQKRMVAQDCGFLSIQDIQAEDVYCIIKAYMRDIDLNQPPLLVLEPRDAEKVFGTSPPSVVPLKPLGKKSVEAIAALIHFLKLPQYGLHAAVGALVDLRDNTAYELNSLTWLDVGRRLPIRPPEPVENAIFDHLPKITWPLRLRPGATLPKGRAAAIESLGGPSTF